MTNFDAHLLQDITRRHFLQNVSTGVGSIALAQLLGACGAMIDKKSSSSSSPSAETNPMAIKLPHFAPKAKRIIYLHMAGAPSQLELFDYKPELQKLDDKDCPESFLKGKRFAFIKGVPKMMGPKAEFKQYGQSGTMLSHNIPCLSQVVDELCIIKSMHTNEFNHAPGQLFMHTGTPRAGRPSIGSWVTYGLGSENNNLPGFIVLASGGKTPDGGKSLWGSGFLPSVYQGIQCRSEGSPVLYVQDPSGMDRDIKGEVIETINGLNQHSYDNLHDPEILSRIAQYEMAYKMQVSVPEVMDISKEPTYIHEMYGTEPGKSSFANNCLLARRLVEQGVRFVQLYDWGWDHHGVGTGDDVVGGIKTKCKETDKPIAALIKDLKQRGMFDDTLVIWGGEFGRTPMKETRPYSDPKAMGRDHNPDAFTIWMAGAGVKAGYSHGETDELGYSAVNNKVHVHDLQATILHLMGFDHEKLTFPYQGRDFRLTDVHGHVVKEVLA
ncbi:MAG: DUF1501 domain-containing protein [Cytophagales bacterium]|nr:DUF1501 domain-containing protein [Cytophagales bacterium]